MEMRGYRNCPEIQRKIKKQEYAMIFFKKSIRLSGDFLFVTFVDCIDVSRGLGPKLLAAN
jgi:hypothetical protein